MTRKKLSWFQLRFPQQLETEQLLAALSSFSGLPFRARVVLDLTATAEGINHLLGVTPRDSGTVTAALRAALPSLRLTPAKAPPRPPRRWLWQVSPRVASLRTDDTAAISAALLSSLFPLEDGETVHLTWTLRTGPRPPLPVGRYDAQDGRERTLRAKLSLPGLNAYGELSATAQTPARRGELTQRSASVLWSLATPFGRLTADPYWYGQAARLLGLRGRYLSAPELALNHR